LAERGKLIMDLQKFIEMGGYAGFVWSAYGLTTLVLLWNWWSARRNEAEAQESARRRYSISQETRS
jgi:heme exporter protein CcmD